MDVFIVHIDEYRKHRANVEVLFINTAGTTTRRKVTVSTLFKKPEVKARLVADKLIGQWQKKLKANNPLVTYIVE